MASLNVENVDTVGAAYSSDIGYSDIFHRDKHVTKSGAYCITKINIQKCINTQESVKHIWIHDTATKIHKGNGSHTWLNLLSILSLAICQWVATPDTAHTMEPTAKIWMNNSHKSYNGLILTQRERGNRKRETFSSFVTISRTEKLERRH